MAANNLDNTSSTSPNVCHANLTCQFCNKTVIFTFVSAPSDVESAGWPYYKAAGDPRGFDSFDIYKITEDTKTFVCESCDRDDEDFEWDYENQSPDDKMDISVSEDDENSEDTEDREDVKDVEEDGKSETPIVIN